MNIGTLTIEMAANVARLSKDMDAARRTVQKTFGNIEKDIARLKNSLGGLFAGLTVGAFTSKLVDVQRQFDVLNSSLVTVTGSSAKAAQEFAWIKQFAATTPYQLSDVTSAFVKMKALGLDASQRALTSYGNTASAMGKGLNQMIEAVADAATGEFERLKEFGIKANKEGDRVKLTFQGITTTIGNSASEITSYLQKIGENQFAGAMAQRAATLDGAISNLIDTWDELFRTINEGNAGGLIYDSVKLASGAVGDLITILQALNGATRDNARDTGAMKTIQEGMAVVFETVAVLGVNLKYVLTAIGTEIGGIAAQAALILQGEFTAAGKVREMMIADAAAARREVDATTARILNARRMAEIAKSGEGQDEPRFRRLMQGMSTSIATVGAAAKKTKDEYAEFVARLNAEDAGVESGFYKNLNLMYEAYTKGRISLEQYQDQVTRYIKQQKFYQDIVKANQQALDDWFEAEAKASAEREKTVKGAEELVDAINFETQALQLNNVERELAIKLLELERLGIKAGSAEYKEYAERIRRAITGRDSVKAGIDARKEAEDEWKKTWDQVSQSFTDALMQGGKSVKEYLTSLFRTMVLRPILSPIGNALGQALGGTGGSAGGGVGGLLNGASTLSNIYNAVTGGFITGLSSTIGSLGSMFGSTAVQSFASGMASVAPGFMGPSLAGAGGAAGAGASVGAFLSNPWTLGAGLVLANWDSLFGRKLKDQGLQGTFGGDGFQGEMYQFFKGGLFRSNKTTTSALDPAMATGLSQQFVGLRSNTELMAAALGQGTEAIRGFTTDIKLSFNGLNEQQIQEKLTEQFSLMADQMAALVPGLEAYTAAGETTAQTLQRLSGSLLSVNGILDTLGYNLIDVSVAGGAFAASVVQAFGGMDALAQQTTYFYENFYSDSERVATTTRQLTTAFAALGLALPDTKESFRGMVDAAVQAGNPALVSNLLKLAPAFISIQGAVGSLVDVVGASRKDTDAAFQALERAVAKQRDAAQVAADLAREHVDAIQSVFDTLRTNVQELYGEVTSTAAMSASQGQVFIAQALETARKTGYLPDADQLAEAIMAARSGIGNTLYATKFEADKARLTLANNLKGLQDIGATQLTAAERQLLAAEAQVAKLDAMLEQYQAQIDAIRGVDNSVLSVADAIRQLAAALAAEKAISTDRWVGDQWVSSGGAVGTRTASGLRIRTKTGTTFSGDDAVAWVNGQLANNDPMAVYKDAVETGISSTSLDALMGWTPGTSSGWAESQDLPAFANGGMHAGGLRVVGERGPEIEATGPARYWSNNAVGGMLGGAELVSEVKALREEVNMLRYEARATAINTAKTKDVLERVAQSDDTFQVKVVA